MTESRNLATIFLYNFSLEVSAKTSVVPKGYKVVFRAYNYLNEMS